jgi:hypothetical protein
MALIIPLIALPHIPLRCAAAAALIMAATVASAAAANAAVIGPDVSSNNHDNRATVNWATIKHAGRASFVSSRPPKVVAIATRTSPQILPRREASD